MLIRAELPRFPFFDVSKVSSKLTSLAFSFGGCKGRTTYLLDPLSKGYVGSLEKDARFSPGAYSSLKRVPCAYYYNTGFHSLPHTLR